MRLTSPLVEKNKKLSTPHLIVNSPRLCLFVKLQVLGLRLGVDFTFTLDNNDNHNGNDNNDNNPHLNFFKGTVLELRNKG